MSSRRNSNSSAAPGQGAAKNRPGPWNPASPGRRIQRPIRWREPLAAFSSLANLPYAHLFHAGENARASEWSLIVAFPQGVVTTSGQDSRNPIQRIQEKWTWRNPDQCDSAEELPFSSGLVGFIGYETSRFMEPSLNLPPSPFPFPDTVLGYYEAAALFSRQQRTAFISGCNEDACLRLEQALAPEGIPLKALPRCSPPISNFSRSDYEARVRQVIDEILAGDYYQANLSHVLTSHPEKAVSAFDLFANLSRESAASFGALLQFPQGAILSNSPERFFRISQEAPGTRRIVAEPIKGTRPRGGTRQEDLKNAQELLSDPKDRAENIMIADLTRNDLSRICYDGSIREESICELLSLANVHHLVSRISGRIRRDVSLTDVFQALFPCGSITGAPKIEAMKAISRLEGRGRGPYCGAIGYLDDQGGADFSVAIRTLFLSEEGRRLDVPVGGGVTLRSDPAAEWKETLAKAQSALKLIAGPDSANL